MKWLSVCSFIFVAILTFDHFRYSYWKESYAEICDLVYENYYKEVKGLKDWHRACLEDRYTLSSSTTIKSLFHRLRFRFGELKTSHLNLFEPVAFKSQWHGEAKSTGLQLHWVDGELVVLRVWPGSPADQAGIQKGDIISRIEGFELDDHRITQKGGNLQLLRRGQKLGVDLMPGKFVRNERIEGRPLGKSAYVLRVPSFRPEFFNQGEMRRWGEELSDRDHVILDLRGNSGGNFIAGLRLMSLFFCEPTSIGQLDQPRKVQLGQTEFQDDMDDGRQVYQLISHRSIELRTFANYPCFSGRVTVLIDHGTASVAEIVASSFDLRNCSEVAGTVSAGRVVLAIWFPLPRFGSNYTVSIPIAQFDTSSKVVLEGQGLSADRTLFYDIEVEKLGKDSWIQHSLKNPPQCQTTISRTGVEELVTQNDLELSRNGTFFAAVEARRSDGPESD